MSVWKQVASSVGGIFKQTAQQIVSEPLEIGQSAVSQISGDMGTSEAGQQQVMPTNQSTNDSNGGFQSPKDLARYEQLTQRKDEIELSQIRSKLQGEFGLETNLEQGMQRASSEYEQKEQERKKAMEQQKEDKKMEELQVKKAEDENIAVMAAKAQASGENKAWGAG